MNKISWMLYMIFFAICMVMALVIYLFYPVRPYTTFLINANIFLGIRWEDS